VLSSFGRAKATLHEISRMLGFAGKASGIDGGQVGQLVAEGRITEVAAYCQEDVVNTYRIWLLHELFCGRLSEREYEASEDLLFDQGSDRRREVMRVQTEFSGSPKMRTLGYKGSRGISLERVTVGGCSVPGSVPAERKKAPDCVYLLVPQRFGIRLLRKVVRANRIVL
jgi:Predicted 3'-5' exonuclease related to the exonuclease domain of PolB